MFSCLAIVGLGIIFEYLRVLQKSIDTNIALSLVKSNSRTRARSRSHTPVEEEGLLTGRTLKADVGGSVYSSFCVRALN